MKATADVDASVYRCGPATGSVRALLRAHAAVDWFVAPKASEEDARRSFGRYHELGRAHAPDLFDPRPSVEVTDGDWAEFQRLCQQARANLDWDWKFGVLKPLTQRHSEARGWQKPEGPPMTGSPPAPGAVFLRIGGAIIWNVPLARLDLSALDAPRREAGQFFKQWVDIDTFEAIEWQLAEPACALEDNPFSRLLDLYDGGHYPFHFSADRVVLFRFRASGPCTTF